MLTTHVAQVTNPNQSGMNTAVEPSPELVDVLSATIDLDNIRAESDGTVIVDTATGRIALGEEDGWITATAYADGDEAMIYEGRSLTDLATAVAQAAK